MTTTSSGGIEHPELAALRARTAALPFVAVMRSTPEVARLLQFLIRLTGARRVLDLGVFTGCSTLAMALAVPPDGTVVAIDIDRGWTEIGREYWQRSGCAARIDLRIGPAVEVLDGMIEENQPGSFDLAFVDADKDAYAAYLERCLVLLRDNGLMIFDNVSFGSSAPEQREARGAPAGPKFLRDMNARYAEGIRRFNQQIVLDERIDIVTLPMGDGVTIARKRPAQEGAERTR
ncbi:MAG: O-methyltransferase [Vicinamibacterales bacterium]